MGADAGHDGGFGIDAGADAGNLPDAGRVLTVVDFALYVQPDGGIVEHPRMGELVSALFFLSDGGLLRLPMVSDGGGVFVAENAPAGPWVIESIPQDTFKAYFDVLDDSQDISLATYLGRPGIPVTRAEYFRLDLMTQPWGGPRETSLQISSRSAGSRFILYPESPLGSVGVYGPYTASAVSGTAIRTTDDARISQFQVVFRDGGAVSSEIVGSAAVGGVTLPGPYVSAILLPVANVGNAKAVLDAGTIASLIGGAGFSSGITIEELAGDLRPLIAAQVFYIDFENVFDSYQFNVPHPSGSPVSAEFRCTLPSASLVPTADGGLEASDAGFLLQAAQDQSAYTIDYLHLDGGVVTPPLVGMPQAILVDGLSVPGVVSASPTVSWSAPATGNTTYYQVIVRRLTRSGNSFVRSVIALLYTTGMRVQIPRDLLVSGERYGFQVSAISTQPSESRRPWKLKLPISVGSRESPIVFVK
ncbi:MAG: fibronectin type III domain-containing protein [Myxococcales bacterium]|nr:fibronectin type III domain-containing protein [Myxococcales bacterium]